jgi:hypothetical protein
MVFITSILLYQVTRSRCAFWATRPPRLLLLNDGDYTRAKEESQARDLHRLWQYFDYNSSKDQPTASLDELM